MEKTFQPTDFPRVNIKVVLLFYALTALGLVFVVNYIEEEKKIKEFDQKIDNILHIKNSVIIN